MTAERGKKIEIGKPLTEKDLLNFELPPVTEKSDDFIEKTPVENPIDNSSLSGEVEQPFQNDDYTPVESVTENNPAEEHRGRLSESGDKYDPSIHAYPPSQTAKTKRWRKKSRKQLEQDKSAAVSQPDPGAAIRKSAENTAFLYGNAHQIPYGENGAIENSDDLLPLINALERHMEQNGPVNTPPLIDVAINAIAYSHRVAMREVNKEKTREIFSRVKGGFVWLLEKTGIKKRPIKEAMDETPTQSEYKPIHGREG